MIKKKSLIAAFSLSKETYKTLERLQNRLGKTRSEIIRELIKSSAKKSSGVSGSRGVVPDFYSFTSDETNKVLKYYYQLISQDSPKPTLVIGIAIINQRGRVIIGLRKPPDQFVKNLTWTFPSGKFNSLAFETELQKTIKSEVGISAKVLKLVHARLIPDSPDKKVRIVALYYHCKLISGKAKPGGDFSQVKWVPATDVTKYFTTSTADEVMNFLGTL